MRTLMFVLAAIGGIFGGSVYVAGYEIPLPGSEPVSFVKTVEQKCSTLANSPMWNYNDPCVHRAVADYKF